MKLAILVIASKGEPYDSFIRNWRSYTFPDWIKVWYVFMEENLATDIEVSNDTIKICGQECLRPGIHYKTCEAMKWITENYEYDYLLRSNLSSWYNFEKLAEWLDNEPKTGYMFGPLWYDNGGGFDRHFLSGCGYAMTRDIVKRFVDWEAGEYVNINVIADDIIVWYFMTNENIPYRSWQCIEYDGVFSEEHMSKNIHCRFNIKDKCPEIKDRNIDINMQARVMHYQKYSSK